MWEHSVVNGGRRLILNEGILIAKKPRTRTGHWHRLADIEVQSAATEWHELESRVGPSRYRWCRLPSSSTAGGGGLHPSLNDYHPPSLLPSSALVHHCHCPFILFFPYTNCHWQMPWKGSKRSPETWPGWPEGWGQRQQSRDWKGGEKRLEGCRWNPICWSA